MMSASSTSRATCCAASVATVGAAANCPAASPDVVPFGEVPQPLIDQTIAARHTQENTARLGLIGDSLARAGSRFSEQVCISRIFGGRGTNGDQHTPRFAAKQVCIHTGNRT